MEATQVTKVIKIRIGKYPTEYSFIQSSESINNETFKFNRHSKEIVLQPSNKTKTNNAQKLPTRQSDSTQTNHVTKSNSNKNNSNSSHRLRQNSPSTSLAHSNAFVALYPYKPQKSDELELKKGCKSSKLFLMISK